jgi:hypothetical protein
MLDAHHVVERLHRKYGPVVRIGPNLLSLGDPSLIKKIYKFDDDWVKVSISDWLCKSAFIECSVRCCSCLNR